MANKEDAVIVLESLLKAIKESAFIRDFTISDTCEYVSAPWGKVPSGGHHVELSVSFVSKIEE